MAWPKGKPRLSEEERAARAAARAAVRDQQYDMDVPYLHGDGRHYGCGKVVIVTKMLDFEAATARGREAMAAHKQSCWATNDPALGERPKREKK